MYLGNPRSITRNQVGHAKCAVASMVFGFVRTFKKMTVPKRWEVATEHKLCFCCLADDHRGETCFRSSVSGLSGCRSAHHRMLHEDEPGDKPSHNERSDLTSGPAGGTTEEGEPRERTHMTTTAMKLTVPSEFVALRTVPVYQTKGRKQVKVMPS